MRFYSVLLVFVFTGLSSAQEINWISMQDALAQQKEVPKKIMVDMYTAWCGPCRMLDKNTFSNKKLAKQNIHRMYFKNPRKHPFIIGVYNFPEQAVIEKPPPIIADPCIGHVQIA